MEQLEVKLGSIESAMAGHFLKATEEMKTLGRVQDETKTAQDSLQKQFDALVLEMQKPGAGSEEKTLATELKENESVSKLLRDGRGTAVVTIKGGLDAFERKTTVTSSAISTSGSDHTTTGVLRHDRVAGIVPAARRKVFVRDLLTTIPTELQKIDYIKVENDISDASPQTEASEKFENAVTFTTAEASVRTIATWMPATKQILADFSGLEGFIRTSLIYAVRKEEEDQILSGDNTGENLNGLITQATAFNTSLLVASDGWEYADMVGRAIQQVEEGAESMPTFVALHPRVWWGIRLQKNTQGDYIYGNPAAGDANFSLFGLTPIRTLAVSATQFLVGSSAPTDVVIRDRETLSVEISTEHSDYFTKNKVAIRAEERLALVCFRPACFIKGTFTQSPA